MKTSHVNGARIRFNVPSGAQGTILRYDGEGFYIVQVDGKPSPVVAHEDDIIVTNRKFNVTMTARVSVEQHVGDGVYCGKEMDVNIAVKAETSVQAVQAIQEVLQGLVDGRAHG